MTFWEKYEYTRKTNQSYVCVGLDSEFKKLPVCLQNEENPIWKFNQEIIDATKDYALAYKPNLAFYASAGKKGYEALEKSLHYIPNTIPVILDAKAGDIGNTMEAYVQAYLKDMGFDAITVNPLMGVDVINPILQCDGKLAFALALTSNPSAKDFLKRENLYQTISASIERWGHEKVGAVVGATNSDELAITRKLMPKTLFLIPGIGAQGGNLEEVVNFASATKEDARFLINVSRGIIFADSSANFARSAQQETIHYQTAINQLL